VAASSRGLPVCSRLLSSYEVAIYLRQASAGAHLADRIAGMNLHGDKPFDREEVEEWDHEASRHRDFLWSVVPGDRVWLTAETPSHPEAAYSVPHLVVIRAGRLVFRYRLPDWGTGREFGPILPRTAKLTCDEAIAIASDRVRDLYAIVPPVAGVHEFVKRTTPRHDKQADDNVSPEERDKSHTHWWVSFACNWDTDKLGLPVTLHVIVDDLTGEAELVTNVGDPIQYSG
jgi:hypothetical protein